MLLFKCSVSKYLTAVILSEQIHNYKYTLWQIDIGLAEQARGIKLPLQIGAPHLAGLLVPAHQLLPMECILMPIQVVVQLMCKTQVVALFPVAPL